MTFSVLKLLTSFGVVTAIALSATPSAAVMPVFIKYDGVDGETAAPPRPSAKPATAMPKVKLTPRKAGGEHARGGRKVKPVKPGPQPALLVPAIQKVR